MLPEHFACSRSSSGCPAVASVYKRLRRGAFVRRRTAPGVEQGFELASSLHLMPPLRSQQPLSQCGEPDCHCVLRRTLDIRPTASLCGSSFPRPKKAWRWLLPARPPASSAPLFPRAAGPWQNSLASFLGFTTGHLSGQCPELMGRPGT